MSAPTPWYADHDCTDHDDGPCDVGIIAVLVAALEKCVPPSCVYDAPALVLQRPKVCHCGGCDGRAALALVRAPVQP